jgi:hypothetical protein
MPDSPDIRLPRQVESDPRCPVLLRNLIAHAEPLWRAGTRHVALVEPEPDLVRSLLNAVSTGHVVRSLERAEQTLAGEEKGLQMADRQQDGSRGKRVSRLIVVTNDGAERFYRHVESLLNRYSTRVLAVRIDLDAAGLGKLLFGSNQTARLVMLTHKTSVTAVLLSLAEQWAQRDHTAP